MADLIYNRGLDELGGGQWLTGVYKFLLLKGAGYVPNRDHDFVAGLTPGANELTVATYARVTATTKTRTIDDALDRITYDCDDPNFGDPVAGETITGMVLFRFVTNDADSILIGYFDVTDFPTDGTNYTQVLGALGVLYVDGT